eukprot:TRINITY_DN40786_c0_g1_i1.p1 TRINITY_DN40786_c0_g1~~TRINITY_DN40786_c0_g1_i1.p1  ORF type:complete len:900 (-),score=129.08 TRINITY_DN40786_c0_g1_i1:339-2939(-)
MPSSGICGFDDLEGIPPPGYSRRNRGRGKLRCSSPSDYHRHINSWQRWSDDGRAPQHLLDKLAREIDCVADDFATHGEFSLIGPAHPDALCISVCGQMLQIPCSEAEVTRILPQGVVAGFGRNGVNQQDLQVRSTLQFQPADVHIEYYSYGYLSSKGKGTGFCRHQELHRHGSSSLAASQYHLDFDFHGFPWDCGRLWPGKGTVKGSLAGDLGSVELDKSMTSANGAHPFMETIRRCLFPASSMIQADLYKLLVYRPGDHFTAPHQDTALGPHHVGSLVFCLPMLTPHSGGTLVVEHGQRKFEFDGQARHSVKWAAFYASCTHHISQVLDGFRIVLVYSISLASLPSWRISNVGHLGMPGHDSTSTPRSRTEAVARALIEAVSHESLPQRPLGLLLKHEYPWKSSTEPRGLKGADREVVEAVRTTGLHWRLQPIIIEQFCDEDGNRGCRVFHAGVPFRGLLKRTVELAWRSLLKINTPTSSALLSEMIEACMDFLMEPLLPRRSPLPMSVNWVLPPQRGLGIALMDGPAGRYTGNECGEAVVHYYHVALLVSTQRASERMLATEFVQRSLHLEDRFFLACRDGDDLNVTRMLMNDIAINYGMVAKGLATAINSRHRCNLEVIQLLMEKQADPCEDELHESAWQAALRLGKWQCAQLLASQTPRRKMVSSLSCLPKQVRTDLEQALATGFAQHGDWAGMQELLARKQSETEELEKQRNQQQEQLTQQNRRLASLQKEVKAKDLQLVQLLGPDTAEDRRLRRKAKKTRKKVSGLRQLQQLEAAIQASMQVRLRRSCATYDRADRGGWHRLIDAHGKFYWWNQYDWEWFFEERSVERSWSLYRDPSTSRLYWWQSDQRWFFSPASDVIN